MSTVSPLPVLRPPPVPPVARDAATAPATSTEVRWTRVLTAERGQFHVEQKDREVICILADPTATRAELVVSSAHRLHPLALSFANRLRLAEPKITFETRYAPVSEIVALYDRNGAQTEPEDRDSTTDQQEIIKQYIREAAKLGASDVKFNIVGPLCRLRYTVHGRTTTYHELPAAEGYALCRTLYNTMTDDINGTGLDENVMQDGQLSAAVARQCGLVGSRIATRPAKGKGLRMTLRLLPPNDNSANLTSLGYLPEQVPIIRELTRLKFGIALFSGVTGSGKSTSLKACIEEILVSSNQETDIITIEDPTEYDIEGEGCLQTPLTWKSREPGAQKAAWANALRNCMRHAPNVLMPGEIRDAESAITAYDAAMTGHFIWSTLHVFDAPSILVRLRRLGVDEDLLFNPALSVGLINQALVRKLCPHCRIPYREGAHLLEPELRQRVETYCTPETVYLAGHGCDTCRATKPGTKGRQVAAEVIRTNAEFMRVFQTEGMNAARIYWVREMGGITKIAHAIRHINAGETDPRHAEQDVGPLNTDHIHLGV